MLDLPAMQTIMRAN